MKKIYRKKHAYKYVIKIAQLINEKDEPV